MDDEKERCSKVQKEEIFQAQKKLSCSKLNPTFSPACFDSITLQNSIQKRFDYIGTTVKLIQHIFIIQIYPFDKILMLMIFNYLYYYSIPSTYFINNLTI